MESIHKTINGCDTYCALFGNAEAPPILFVHGFPLCGEMWYAAAEAISDRWRCIVPDLRGHGQTQATPEASMAQYAADLGGLLDSIGERRPVVLVGLSMGGMIAFEFFRRHRNRLRALVLSNTRAIPDTPEGVAKREAVAQTALREGSAAVVDAMLPTLFGPAIPDDLRRRWRDIMARTPSLGIAAAARALAHRPDSRPTLAQIDCPTLVVAGDADKLTPLDQLEEIHRGIPGSRLAVIAQCGHVPPVEQPQKFNSQLQSLLDGLL